MSAMPCSNGRPMELAGIGIRRWLYPDAVGSLTQKREQAVTSCYLSTPPHRLIRINARLEAASHLPRHIMGAK